MSPQVLHVITGLGAGGAERTLASLVLAERAAGRAAAVAALTADGPWRAPLEAAGVTIHDLGMRRGRADPMGAVRLARVIRAARPAIVQGWMYHADLLAWAGLALSGRRGATRLVWSIRCSDMDIRRYGMLFRATLGAWKRIASRADAVIANSDAGAAFHRGLGCRFRRVVRIDNGVDTARFRPDPASRAEVRRELGLADDAVVAVLLGRVDPMKGHDAFVRSLDRTPEVVGLAAGLGTEGLPRRPNLRALGLRDDVPRLLAATDVLVSASLFGEGFPNAVVEAMGCGLPVVATDVGDTRRIVGEAGVVVGARDGDAMTAALHTLAADPDLRRRLGEGARRRVEEHFSLARMIAGYAAAYEDLIRR